MKTLTLAYITSLIESEEYFTSGTLTICALKLKNGAQVTGESNCIDPDNYSAEIGKSIARDQAVDKIWQLEGYAVKTRGA